MLAVTKLLISNEGLAPILLCWAFGVAFIVSLAVINRRRIRSHERDA